MRFQSNVSGIATWLFLPRLVNQHRQTLPLTIIMASAATSAQGVSGQEGKESDVLFPKDHSNITQRGQILPDPWKKKSHLKISRDITNSSNCCICSQLLSPLDESIHMIGLPTPGVFCVFSTALPPTAVMLLLKGKAAQSPPDQCPG